MNRALPAILICALAAPLAHAQVKTTREQILFYTSDWHGERFPDGRPKLPDSLLTRALSVSLEDVWDFLREHKYNNQFEGNWQSLHPDRRPPRTAAPIPVFVQRVRINRAWA